MDWHFTEHFTVRDYECDLQGIVNNAEYFHYYEHTRNTFLKSSSLSLSELHNKGIDPVVIRAEIDYKYPLRADDTFDCRLRMERESDLKLMFIQEIALVPSGRLASRARITVVFLKNGIPSMPDEALDMIRNYIAWQT
ncbi:MAG: acyl-CoA thioesterase [Spirochaetota bacterium]